jgi:hypothetical protein
MDIAITELVDAAGRAGWSISETPDAIARAVPNQRKAYYLDPHPVDDLVE